MRKINIALSILSLLEICLSSNSEKKNHIILNVLQIFVLLSFLGKKIDSREISNIRIIR